MKTVKIVTLIAVPDEVDTNSDDFKQFVDGLADGEAVENMACEMIQYPVVFETRVGKYVPDMRLSDPEQDTILITATTEEDPYPDVEWDEWIEKAHNLLKRRMLNEP